MYKSTKFIYFIVIFSFCTATAISKDFFEAGKAGISAEYSIDFQSVDIQNISELETCCPKILDGRGNSFDLLFNYAVPLTETSYLSFSPGIKFGKFETNAFEYEEINFDSINIKGIFEHNFDANFKSFIFRIEYYQDLVNTFGFGININYSYFFDKNYEYREVLVAPADRGYFEENGSRIRNSSSGDLNSFPAGSLNAGIYITNEFPLEADFKWSINPRFGFKSLIYDFNNNIDWNYISIYFGITIYNKIF